jgi:hypothetical protein
MTLKNDRPVLSSERAPHMNRTETFEQEEISGHESQAGLDTKQTDWLTDRQSQCDFDLKELNSLPASCGLLCDLFFDPEDVSNMFLQNVCWLSTN